MDVILRKMNSDRILQFGALMNQLSSREDRNFTSYVYLLQPITIQSK